MVSRREGKWIHYSIDNVEGLKVVELLRALTEDQSEGTKAKNCRM